MTVVVNSKSFMTKWRDWRFYQKNLLIDSNLKLKNPFSIDVFFFCILCISVLQKVPQPEGKKLFSILKRQEKAYLRSFFHEWKNKQINFSSQNTLEYIFFTRMRFSSHFSTSCRKNSPVLLCYDLTWKGKMRILFKENRLHTNCKLF